MFGVVKRLRRGRVEHWSCRQASHVSGRAALDPALVRPIKLRPEWSRGCYALRMIKGFDLAFKDLRIR